MTYTFESLSPADFEDLVRDLLQEELNLTLESFKAGPDQGIDLRYSRAPTQQLVVQCKHYRGSGFAALISHLKKQELPKIQQLAPRRYILATSVDLSPLNKSHLSELLAPFVSTPQDIYGGNDLNNLLGKHPIVEKRHFKLWLASVESLTRFLNHAQHVRSENLVARVKERLRLYVHNDSFGRALSMLSEHRTCIIAGAPGIGKTTLADVLMVHHMDQDYEVIEVTNDIGEADAAWNSGAKQFFYYDDFLGTAFDEHLPKNEDSRLLAFMRRVANSADKRLVLTTREYIFRSATARYEKLATGIRFDRKCVISMEDYTPRVRAKILYNHVYFSALPGDARKALVADESYFNVVDHDNFSPRLVEHAIEFAIDDNIPGSSFPQFLLDVLDDPVRLWDHAFRHQVPDSAQCLLLALLFLPRGALLPDLQQSAQALAALRLKRTLSDREFRLQLRFLDGTFITLDAPFRRSGERTVAFHTPAVGDYLLSYLNVETTEIPPLLRSVTFFEQAVNICLASASGGRGTRRYPGLTSAIRANGTNLSRTLEASLGCRTCVPRRFAFGDDVHERQPSEDARLASLLTLAGKLEIDAVTGLANRLVARAFPRWVKHDGDRVAIAKILAVHVVPQEVTAALHNWAIQELRDAEDFALVASIASRDNDAELRESVKDDFDIYVDAQESYILHDADDPNSAQDVIEEVEELGKDLQLTPYWDSDAITERLMRLERRDEDEDVFDYEQAMRSHKDSGPPRSDERKDISDLFSTLTTDYD